MQKLGETCLTTSGFDMSYLCKDMFACMHTYLICDHTYLTGSLSLTQKFGQTQYWMLNQEGKPPVAGSAANHWTGHHYVKEEHSWM